MRFLAVFLEPAFWVLRIVFALAVYAPFAAGTFSTNRGFFSHPLVPLGCAILWLVGGVALTGVRGGTRGKRILTAVISDLIPAVLLTYLVKAPAVSGAFLLPLLDAAVGDGVLFGAVTMVGVAELIALGWARYPAAYASASFYIHFIPFLLSLLFASYVFRFYRQSKRSETLITLIEMGQSLGATLNMDTVASSLEDVLRTLYHFNAFALFLADESEKTLKVKVSRSGFPAAFTDFAFDKESILTKVLKTREGIIVPDVRRLKDPILPPLRAFRSAAILPLHFEGAILGEFVLIHPSSCYFNDEDLRVLTVVANQVAIAVKNVRLHEKTTFLAVTDSLTGLYTHGYFQASLQTFLEEQGHAEKPVSVLMIDLDWFKRVNDTFGHPQGDRILSQLSRVIKNLFTPRDVLARYGGDEFVCLIPDANKMAAIALAERIRKTVQDVPFMVPGSDKSLHLSVSIGVASFPEDGTKGGELIEMADKAMYQAKQTGRNKIVFAGQKETTP